MRREHQQSLFLIVQIPDADESEVRIAAVEKPLDHLLDHRPEEAVFSLEADLVLGLEPINLLLMSRTIASRHDGRRPSENEATSPMKPELPEKKKEAQLKRAVLVKKKSIGVDARFGVLKRPEAIQ